MDEMNKTKCSFNILPITNSADRHSAMDFLKKYYFRDEPVNACISLLKERESVIKLENFCDTYLHNGISLMAISEKGELIGVMLNNKTSRDKEKKYVVDDDKKENSKYNDIMTLLAKIQGEVDLYGNYPNVNHIMHICVAAVNDAYRGKGVCKALIAKTKEKALELGCQMIHVECSSLFTAKAVEKFDFKCIYSLNYLDYVNQKGEVIFKPQSPHEYIKIYVLLL